MSMISPHGTFYSPSDGPDAPFIGKSTCDPVRTEYLRPFLMLEWITRLSIEKKFLCE